METQNDHDLLIKLESKISELVEKIEEMKEAVANGVKDHERRIRFLEKSLYLTWGGITVITAIIYYASNFFKK